MLKSLKDAVRKRSPRVTAGYRLLYSYWTGRRWIGKGMNAFREIHRHNVWNDRESKSGSGSSLRGTEAIRAELPRLLDRHAINSILDVPCGDFYWMAMTTLGDRSYTGAELIPDIVQELQAKYGTDQRKFICADMSVDNLPQVDLILCRDCLVHFSYADIRTTLQNFRRSGAKFLLTTTYPNHVFNVDCPTGHWRTLNWQLPPFEFPPPIEIMWDDVVNDAGRGDKNLGLWTFDTIPMS